MANVGWLMNTEEAKAFGRKLMAHPLALRCDTTYDHLDATRNCILHPVLHNRSTLFSAPSGPSSIAEAYDSLSLSPVFVSTSLQRDPSQFSIQTECYGELHTCEPEWLEVCAWLCVWGQTRCLGDANFMINGDLFLNSSCRARSRL